MTTTTATTAYGNRSGFGAQATITITGNTFAAKDQIKANGGRWNPKTKTWTMPVPPNNKGAAALAYFLRSNNLGWK